MGLIQNQSNNGSDECQAAYSGPRAHSDSLSRVVPHFSSGQGVRNGGGAYRQTCVASENANLQKMVSIFMELTTSGTVTL
jgi:hypothetical protein